MKCNFYGPYEVPSSVDPSPKAMCPRCGAVRMLQPRSGGWWFFPHHSVIDGSSNETRYLVFVDGRFRLQADKRK